MAEFVGIEPGGAWQLIRRMEAAKEWLGTLRPSLEAAIHAAGPDWAGTQGTAAMHRAWAFLDESQQDLKWRIETITRLVETSLDGARVIPDEGTVMLTARFPFRNSAEAAEAGKRAGEAIAARLAEYGDRLTPESLDRVNAAIAAARPGVSDPAFATAALNAIGPETFRGFFHHWMRENAPGLGRGLDPRALERADASLGVLARLFATADHGGHLGDHWHRELLRKADATTLSALLALAPQSSTFLNRAAYALISIPSAGRNNTSPFADWNTHWVITAYQGRPEDLQRLLATEPAAAYLLLRPQLVKIASTPGLHRDLADVLGRALSQDVGDPATRDMAWFNLVNALGNENATDVGGHYLSLENSLIDDAIVRNIRPYLEHLSFSQIREGSPVLAHHFPSPAPWDKLDPDVAARFVGGLLQDDGSRKHLQQEFTSYVRELDIGKAHPFSSDKSTRALYTIGSAKSGGLANLILAGSTHAELNDDQFADLIAETATLPVDYFLNWIGARTNATPGESTGVSYAANPQKKAVSDLIRNYFDQKTPETAEVVANRLIDDQLVAIVESLENHGQGSLTPEDQDRIDKELRGRLLPALIDALKARGG